VTRRLVALRGFEIRRSKSDRSGTQEILRETIPAARAPEAAESLRHAMDDQCAQRGAAAGRARTHRKVVYRDDWAAAQSDHLSIAPSIEQAKLNHQPMIEKEKEARLAEQRVDRNRGGLLKKVFPAQKSGAIEKHFGGEKSSKKGVVCPLYSRRRWKKHAGAVRSPITLTIVASICSHDRGRTVSSEKKGTAAQWARGGRKERKFRKTDVTFLDHIPFFSSGASAIERKQTGRLRRGGGREKKRQRRRGPVKALKFTGRIISLTSG